MNYHNYHTHTLFCDGADKPENYVLEAIRLNMETLGFSGHAPVPFENAWSTKEEKIDEYFSIVESLKKKYAGKINLLKSLEIDYIPGITKEFSSLRNLYNLDYTIGSVHLVKEKNNDTLWFIDGPDKNYITGLENIFNNDIRKAVRRYYSQIREMIITQKPDIIGHLDKVKMNNKKRFFTEDEKWYKESVYETLKTISANSCIVEANTRGIYKKKTDSLFPSLDILEQCLELNIPVTVNSDAHQPSELTAYFPETIQILKDIGFKGIYLFNKGKWKQISL